MASASHPPAHPALQPADRLIPPPLPPRAAVETSIGPPTTPPSAPTHTRPFNRACAPARGTQTLIRLLFRTDHEDGIAGFEYSLRHRRQELLPSMLMLLEADGNHAKAIDQLHLRNRVINQRRVAGNL